MVDANDDRRGSSKATSGTGRFFGPHFEAPAESGVTIVDGTTRRNRFRWKTLNESLNSIEINVYRSTKKVALKPLSDVSFVYDGFLEYRELCLHKAFLDVVSEIHARERPFPGASQAPALKMHAD